MAREDFWKEVMLSWTLKDELESDTKEKLVSSQYFPLLYQEEEISSQWVWFLRQILSVDYVDMDCSFVI